VTNEPEISQERYRTKATRDKVWGEMSPPYWIGDKQGALC